VSNTPAAEDTLGPALSEATGLDESLSRLVIETAMTYIASRRPGLARRAERALANKERAVRAAARIAHLARALDPR